MARGVVLSFAVLLAAFDIGACLNCYECVSANQPGCGEPFKSTDLTVDCTKQAADVHMFHRTYISHILPGISSQSGANQYCLKVTDITGKSTGRTCVYANNENEIKHLCDSVSPALKTCQYCNKDYCNGSSAIASSVPVALLALIAAYLFNKQ